MLRFKPPRPSHCCGAVFSFQLFSLCEWGLACQGPPGPVTSQCHRKLQEVVVMCFHLASRIAPLEVWILQLAQDWLEPIVWLPCYPSVPYVLVDCSEGRVLAEACKPLGQFREMLGLLIGLELILERGWGRRFSEWPEPLHWIAFPVEILTKPLIHCIASPLCTENPFFSLKSASSHPLPKNRLWLTMADR